MNKLLRQSQLFLKRNGSTILTCLGGAGVVATAVLAVKATPKALAQIDAAKEEKGEDLTKLEMVTVAGPAYIPAIITGTATLACVFGANVLNTRQQASLMSAYALLDSSFKDYKNKVKELYGAEADIQITEDIVRDKYEEQEIVMEDSNKQLFYDKFSERYFESTLERVLDAQLKLNRMLAEGFGAYLNEYYELLGLDVVNYGDFLGWSPIELTETYWVCWVDFVHQKVVMDDGLECTIIEIVQEPTFDFENYW